MLISGPWLTPTSVPLPTFSFMTSPASFSDEVVVDAVLHVDAVGADAGLAHVAELRDHRALDRGIEIGVVEDDERRVAAELEADLLHRRGRLAHQQLADLGRAGEGRRSAPRDGRSAPRRSRCALPVTTLRTPGGMPARSASTASASAVSGVSLAGLHHHRAAGGERRADLARDHRGREIPRRDRRDDADRLADDDDAGVGAVARDGLAVDALRLLGVELDERGGVVDLAARLRPAACPARSS